MTRLRYIMGWAGALALFAIAHAAQAQDSGTVLGTLHDLSNNAGANAGLPGATTSDTGEVCVFCHTPHSGQPDTVFEAPLWNKLDPSSAYTTYDSSTIDSPAPLTVGSVSAACLSCHDGSQAIDVVVNAPGTGGIDDVDGSSLFSSPTNIGAMGALSADLGVNLTNDHPIGIEYAGGVDETTGALVADLDFTVPQRAVVGGKVRWWVDTPGVGTVGVREKTDMILYTRSDGATADVTPYVECASCHDPHSGDTADTNPNTIGSVVSFMRVANTGSAVCLACHDK